MFLKVLFTNRMILDLITKLRNSNINVSDYIENLLLKGLYEQNSKIAKSI